MTDESFDLLIIGGGIVGAGVARDAATRGLRTLLVEQSDFASGTSSRSSRLLHGGLRYLAQGRVGLVREASIEKMRLSRIAPHLSQPLPFLFPVWDQAEWKLWKLSVGVKLYDLLCGRRNLGSSATLGPDEVVQRVPGLRRAGLRGATRHYDGLTNDARLVIDTLRAAEAAGAVVRNYTSFRAATPRADGPGWDCQVEDERTGATHAVRAGAVVNAAGAWAARFPRSGVRLRLTKGIHLVIDRSRLAPTEAVVLTEGKRILFVIPWGERVILGTTDTDFEGDPAQVRVDESDVAYVLGIVNNAFPEARVVPEDVISSWAGVRPLIAPRETKAGTPSDTSRNHEIRMPEPGWFDVAGGKLTTYRLMAEQVVDRVGRALGSKLPGSRTDKQPIAPGPFSGILPPPVSAEVVREGCRREWAVHLDDVMLRRTSWHYYHADHEAIADQVAGWMAEELGWDGERVAAERDRLRAAVAHEGAMSLIQPGPSGSAA